MITMMYLKALRNTRVKINDKSCKSPSPNPTNRHNLHGTVRMQIHKRLDSRTIVQDSNSQHKEKRDGAMSRRPSLFWRRLSLQAWRTSPCGVASRCAAVYPRGAGTSAFRDREADGFRFAVAQNILPGLVPGCPAWDRQQDQMGSANPSATLVTGYQPR